MRVPEREPCQHTSCSACRFILEPDCPTCPVPVKKRCLRHFELCVERHNARDDIILVRACSYRESSVNIFMKPFKYYKS